MRLIEIDKTLDLEVTISAEEILADLMYPAHAQPMLRGTR